MDTHTHTHIHIHKVEEVTKLPLRGTIAGGSWEGKRERVYSHCAILGGKALFSGASLCFPHSHPLGLVAGVGCAVGNVKSPVALPLPLGAGFFCRESYLSWARLG